MGCRTIILAMFFVGLLFKGQSQSKEYLLKATFLEKFATFTEWPNTNLSDEFIITVLGNSPFDFDLSAIYKDRKIKDTPIRIKYIKSLSEIEKCNILFISYSEEYQLSKILEITENKPILTIGETKGYGEKGVLINFYTTQKGTIHFEINAKKVKQSGLIIDAMLLNYALIVN